MDFRDIFLPGDITPGILLQMELAPLPQNPGEEGIDSSTQSTMVVGANHPQAMKPSFDQTFKKAPPVDLGLIEGHLSVENMAVTFIVHPKGH
jgi:hypothetical protein